MTGDLEDLAAALQAAVVKVPKMMDLAIRKTTFDIQGDAMIAAPFVTGNLKGSVGSEVSYLKGTIFVTAYYGRFVEEGTKPHEISAKPGHMLKFAGSGGPVFTSKVSHPGTKAQPFVQPSVDRRLPALYQAAADIASRIL